MKGITSSQPEEARRNSAIGANLREGRVTKKASKMGMERVTKKAIKMGMEILCPLYSCPPISLHHLRLRLDVARRWGLGCKVRSKLAKKKKKITEGV